MQFKLDRDIELLLTGGTLGASLVYFLMLKARKKMVHLVIEDLNLRTDLINWIVSEGVYLEEDDFFSQYKEKAMFVKIVTNRVT